MPEKKMDIERECIETETEIIVLGQPDSEDESHSCDCMGCSYGLLKCELCYLQVSENTKLSVLTP